MAKNFTAATTTATAAGNAWNRIQSETPAEKPASNTKPTDEGEKKSARTTFLCTPEKWEQLQALCTYYAITGQTVEGKTATPNRLLNVAIDAYLKDHAADLEQYKAITGKLQKGKTVKI